MITLVYKKKLHFIFSHDHRLIHGAIHPNNVFLTSDGRAVLGDYDFTKKLEQRAEKTYVSRKGLTFAAPEVTARSSVTRKTDMYSLGVIAYWVGFELISFPGPEGSVKLIW